MARKFGWTLTYIDSLSMEDQHEYWQILDGEGKAQAQLSKTGKAPRKRRR